MNRCIEITVAVFAAVATAFSAAAGYFSYKASQQANHISKTQLLFYLDDVRFDFQYLKDKDRFEIQRTGTFEVILQRVWVKPMFSTTEYLPADEVELPVTGNRTVSDVATIVCDTGRNKKSCERAEISSYHIRYSILEYADLYDTSNDELRSARFQRSQTISVND